MRSAISIAFLAVFCLAVSGAAPKNQCGVSIVFLKKKKKLKQKNSTKVNWNH
jgi:hypothetical protein